MNRLTSSEEQTFLDDLDKKLWNAADRLRSNLDAAVYKHAVLGLIFLKYVSDAFDLRREELERAFRDPKSDYHLDRADYKSDAAYAKAIHAELEDRDYFTEKNVFWVPPLARWQNLREHAALAPDTVIEIRNGKTEKYTFRSAARLIDDALEAVEKENHRLKGVIEKNRYMQLQLEPAKLVGLISEVVSSIPFRHASLNAKDILGHVYEYFLGKFALAEGKKGGQYYTPKSIVSVIVEMLEPYSGKIAAAERMGVRAVTLNSENLRDWAEVEAKLQRDEVDILLISPERLANLHFITDVLAPVAGRVSLLVIDEAHCISDWGHDFRPHYRLIERIIRTMPPNLRVLATTATANNRVLDDLRNILGPSITVSRGELGRPSLLLQTIRLPRQADRLAWLAAQIPRIAGSGIIYTLTVRDAVQVAGWLKARDIDAEAYTGESGERRVELENALLENRVKCLVATTALGMGFDKPDLAFVIHYQTPGSVVAYYQQVGRAGRAIAAAYGVLLSGQEETNITDYFIESAFPSRKEVGEVLAALQSAEEGLSIPELMARVNVGKGRIDKTLQLLSLESPPPITKDGSKWTLTAAALSEGFWQRAERLTSLRRDEQRQMQDYVALNAGHMDFLIRALDGTPTASPSPRLTPLSVTVDASLAAEAVNYLRRTSLPLDPRKQWPAGGLSALGVTGGNIPANMRAQPGKVLCVWGDAGWGDLVRQGKARDGHFDDALVEASASLVRAWGPQPAPAWVTCIPSRRHLELVPDFARRLAARLALPFHQVLAKSDDRPEQKSMANSSQQARNVDGALTLAGTVPAGPVLLVDDMVDSRWTLTVAAYLILRGGGGPVFPFALASTAHADE